MTQARYDAVADFYVAAFDVIDDPASQALLSLLGPPAGLRVLDVACGHGRITRELARRGAEVTGVDISAALIGKASAAERAEPLGIRYIHADIAALQPAGHAVADQEAAGLNAAGLNAAGLNAAGLNAGAFDTGTFDAVTCNFGLSDIDDLDGAIAAVGTLLRPGGCFVFSILHPCFPGAADVSASWPAAARYYDEGRWHAEARLSQLRRQVGANHRMLSTYLNTFRRHDLSLDEVSEPVPAAQWSRNRPGADNVPVYLAARYIKA